MAFKAIWHKETRFGGAFQGFHLENRVVRHRQIRLKFWELSQQLGIQTGNRGSGYVRRSPFD